MNGVFVTDVGTFAILEIFCYYDWPRLFSCRSNSGQLCIGLWVSGDDKGEEWLFTPVSSERLEAVRIGLVPVKSAFRHPEDGWLYKMIADYSSSSIRAERINPDAVDDDSLPDPDAFLRLSPSEVPSLGDADILQAARASMRDTVDIILRGHPDRPSGFVDQGPLGAALVALQRLVCSKALEHHRGRISRADKERIGLMVSAFAPGSFAIRTVSRETTSLLDDTPVSLALEFIHQAMRIGADAEQLSALLKEQKPLTVARYRAFLSAVSQGGCSVEFRWAPASGKSGVLRAQLSQGQIMTIIQMLKEWGDEVDNDYTVVGTLLAVNTRQQRFELMSDDGIAYRGRISEQLQKHVFTIPSTVRATIRETVEINPTTNEESISYSLLDVEYATSAADETNAGAD